VPVHGRRGQPDPNAGEHLAVEHRRSEDHTSMRRPGSRRAGRSRTARPGVTIARGASGRRDGARA
jgi:hypothetical protein